MSLKRDSSIALATKPRLSGDKTNVLVGPRAEVLRRYARNDQIPGNPKSQKKTVKGVHKGSQNKTNTHACKPSGCCNCSLRAFYYGAQNKALKIKERKDRARRNPNARGIVVCPQHLVPCPRGAYCRALFVFYCFRTQEPPETMGPKMITHILVHFGIHCPITQDVCCTGFLAGIILCNSGVSMRYFL